MVYTITEGDWYDLISNSFYRLLIQMMLMPTLNVFVLCVIFTLHVKNFGASIRDVRGRTGSGLFGRKFSSVAGSDAKRSLL